MGDDKEVRIGLRDAAQACDFEFLPPLRVRFNKRILTNLKNVRSQGAAEPSASKTGDELPNEEEKRHQDGPKHSYANNTGNLVRQGRLRLIGEPHKCQQGKQHSAKQPMYLPQPEHDVSPERPIVRLHEVAVEGHNSKKGFDPMR